MKYLKDQQGVALILELVLVAVVLAAAGVGVYAAIHHQPAPTATKTTSPTPAPSSSSTPAPSPSIRYFTIAEWGVRAPYTGSDSYTYTITTGSWGALATVVSARLAASYPGCSTFGAGQIKRLSPTAIASQVMATTSNLTVQQLAQQDSSLKHVGNYYYLFMHDDAACDTSSTGSTAQNAANTAVQALVAKLQPIN